MVETNPEGQRWSGERTPAIEFMEKVAIHYNMSLSEFLSFGEALAQGRPVCPFCHDLKGATPEDRAAEIVSRTNLTGGTNTLPGRLRRLSFIGNIYQNWRH